MAGADLLQGGTCAACIEHKSGCGIGRRADTRLEHEFGKTQGLDLEEGVYTLPVIHCLASADRDKVVRVLYSRSHRKRR